MRFSAPLDKKGYAERTLGVRRSPVAAYGIALGAVAIATIARWAVGGGLIEGVPFITYFPAIIIAALIGGFWPGVTATVLSAVLAWYLFLPSRADGVFDAREVVSLLLFASVSGVSVGIVGLLDARVERILAQEQNLRVMLDSAPSGIVAIDAGGTIKLVNKAAEALFGYGASELIGRQVEVLVPERFRGKHPAFRASYAAEPSPRPMGAGRDLFALRKDGSEVPVEIGLSSVRTETGPMVLASIADITERKRAEQALRESERRTEFALTAGQMGAWEWEIGTGRVIWSPGLEAIHGLKPGTFGGHFEDFKREICPQDLEWVLAEVRKAVKTGEDYHVAYRISRPDGALRWLEAFGRVVRRVDGKPQKMAGVCMDITERKYAEERQSRLAAIVDSSRDAILSKSLDGTVTSWNPAAEKLFGYSPDEIIGQPIQQIVPADRLAEEDEILARLRSGLGVELHDTERVTKDGRRVPVSITVSPVRDSAGIVTGASSIVRDITDRKLAEEKEKVLIRELQHRTANIIAVVQAIARKTLAGDYSLDQARMLFEARLQSIARTHRRLMQSNWIGLTLNDIVRAELEPFAAQIKIKATDLMLNAQYAQDFSLLLHELATNAAKYGALSTPGGWVHISWTVTGEGDCRRMQFRWQERDGPATAAPEHPGFGTTLIKAMFPGGRFEYAAEGFLYEVDMPLGSILPEMSAA